MTFEEALIEFKKGKSIKRKGEQFWTHSVKYNTLKISWLDVLANDWEIA